MKKTIATLGGIFGIYIGMQILSMPVCAQENTLIEQNQVPVEMIDSENMISENNEITQSEPESMAEDSNEKMDNAVDVSSDEQINNGSDNLPPNADDTPVMEDLDIPINGEGNGSVNSDEQDSINSMPNLENNTIIDENEENKFETIPEESDTEELLEVPEIQIGWNEDKTKYYDGEKWVTGKFFVKEDNSYYYFDPITGVIKTGLNENCYYQENGQIYYGQKIIEGFWYYFDKNTNGIYSIGFVDIPKEYNNEGAKRVYYDQNGRMQFGQIYLEGYWYYLNPGTGEMCTGFVNIPKKNEWWHN